jgi:ribosomal protein L11 methyltransferase
MLELFPEGFEELTGNGSVELAAYTNAAGEERIWQAFGGAASADVAGDWEDRWRQFHKPVRVGRIWIGPPWEEPDDGAIPVVIDPGRAFGTGGHPTTQLCLQLLEAESRGSVLDVGCGSGVLSIAASKLGFAPVLALDFDPLAVEATAANARVNGAEVAAERVDLRAAAAPSAPTVVANLLRPLLLELRFDEVPRTLIASGLLREEADEVAAAFADRHGLAEADRRSGGDWAALLLRQMR